MKSSVNIIATDPNGKKIQKAITDINPNASTAQLRDFVQNLNGLTNNTLGTPVRIDRTELVDESTLLDRNMRFSTTGSDKKNLTRTLAELESATANNGLFEATFTYAGTGVPYIKKTTSSVTVSVAPFEEDGSVSYQFLAAAPSGVFSGDNAYSGAAGTITIAIDASDGYKSDEITFTITE